jgi:hypothetical protein
MLCREAAAPTATAAAAQTSTGHTMLWPCKAYGNTQGTRRYTGHMQLLVLQGIPPQRSRAMRRISCRASVPGRASVPPQRSRAMRRVSLPTAQRRWGAGAAAQSLTDEGLIIHKREGARATACAGSFLLLTDYGKCRHLKSLPSTACHAKTPLFYLFLPFFFHPCPFPTHWSSPPAFAPAAFSEM